MHYFITPWQIKSVGIDLRYLMSEELVHNLLVMEMENNQHAPVILTLNKLSFQKDNFMFIYVLRSYCCKEKGQIQKLLG